MSYRPRLPDWFVNYIDEVKDLTETQLQEALALVNDLDSDKPFKLTAYNPDTDRLMDLDEFCQYHKLPRHLVKNWRLCTHTGVPYYNIGFHENKVVHDLDTKEIEKTIERLSEPVKPSKFKWDYTCDYSRLIYTDAHIGMDPTQEGRSLYGGKWDKSEVNKRLYITIERVLQKAQGKVLIIDDLADLVDGQDGKTVRRAHDLPQNMTNEQMFDVALEFKVRMIDKLASCFDKIICHNICEDNHAGSFGYYINQAFKKLIELKYTNVEVHNYLKFINHYYIGDHAFILTHGKDSKNLKFGFKPHLDDKQIQKIDQYLKFNDVYSKAKFIEFSKGDSHQKLFDETSSDDFDYFNYPAFSPSSNWIQSNFKKGRSGIVIQNFNTNEQEKDLSHKWFDWHSDKQT